MVVHHVDVVEEVVVERDWVVSEPVVRTEVVEFEGDIDTVDSKIVIDPTFELINEVFFNTGG